MQVTRTQTTLHLGLNPTGWDGHAVRNGGTDRVRSLRLTTFRVRTIVSRGGASSSDAEGIMVNGDIEESE